LINDPGVRLGGTGASFTFDGVISGAGSLTKAGAGVMTLTGASTPRSTRVEGGALAVNGSIASTFTTQVTNATLTGTGNVQTPVFITSGGTIRPGSLTSPGVLHTGRLQMGAGTASFATQLNSAAAFGQLVVTGTTTVSGNLIVTLGSGYAPAIGTQFTIIDNDDVDVVAGFFNGKFEGTTFNVDGFKFQISYAGGTGNDVVLTSLGSADLAVTMTGPSSVASGSDITYNITVTNNGPTPAPDVVVTDTNPSSVLVQSIVSSQGTCSSGPFTQTCTLGPLAVSASASIQLTVKTVTSTPSPAVNVASASTSANDPIAANNSATVSTTLMPTADLEITQTAQATVFASVDAAYSLLVGNLGGSTATSVTVTDTLPVGTSLVSAITSQGSCSGTTTVTCSLGTIFFGQGPVQVILVVSTGGSTVSPMINTATVSSAVTDPNPANNQSTAQTIVTPLADLSLTHTEPASVYAGHDFTTTLIVRNNGPSSATGVVLTDALFVQPVSVSTTQGSCLKQSDVVCTIGTMAVGASVSVTVVQTASRFAPNYFNAAHVSSDVADPNSSNDFAELAGDIIPNADLEVLMTAPASATPGQIQYVIKVSNKGPSFNPSVTLTDLLPAGTTFSRLQTTQGSCTVTAAQVTCAIGNMNASTTATVILDLQTSGQTPSPVVNTVTVSSAIEDLVSGNNSVTASTSVACYAINVQTLSSIPVLGADYVRAFAGIGGVSPQTFALAGTLPQGLTFTANGRIRGIPTELGAFPLTVTATDKNSCQGSLSFTIAVSRARFVAVGPGAGGAPNVRTFRDGGAQRAETAAFAPEFTGGVSVALGDVTGDGVADLIAGAGPGGGPHVIVMNGVTGAPALSFFAYDPSMTTGVEVAAADFTRDGVPDIVTVPGLGGPPLVRIFDGRTSALVREFLVPSATASGGLHIAAADVNGDGLVDLVVGNGPFGVPLVQVFDGGSFALLRSFLAYESVFPGGVYVAAGDVNGDGYADIVTGAGAGGGPHVKVFDGVTNALLPGPLGSFFGYDPAFSGGVRVAAGDVDGDGRAEVITGAGPGGGPHVRVWDGATGEATASFFAFDASFGGGVFVAGPPPPLGRMAIGLPQPGSTPSSVRVAGWALVETAADTVGTDAIHAWAYPAGGGAPMFVGSATGRVDRPDVSVLFGGEFLKSGFDFTGALPPGTYDLVVFARNAKTGIFDQWRSVRITVAVN
jgi:uncharacterized repeat protein (TIGR01451 family)